MPHDIIDNRNENLVEHINLILDSTEVARFAVGYFFPSGFQSIVEEFNSIKELPLFVSNTTNRKTQVSFVEIVDLPKVVCSAALV